ncbi:4Fe-4S binding protein [Aeoliella mucimassa]|nr:4Fe-4S binding protein [Aeoliella mucimassa]
MANQKDRTWTARQLMAVLVLLALLPYALAQAQDYTHQEYTRQATTAPQVDDIGGDYALPEVQQSLPRSVWLQGLDVILLIAGMGAIAYAVHRGRRRWVITVVTLGSLAYFGFYRQGCVCPIGATQNVAASIVDPELAVPMVVLVFFLLPLLAALLFGRVFCGGVCPLGAIQDVVLLRPMQLPAWIDRWGGLFKYVYLGLAIWFAVLPAEQRDFIICRFDPFVGFFRMTGVAWLMGLGVALLLIGTVIGRPYCRFLCPYGGLLAIVSRFSFWPVSITPDEELDCGLCVDSCPFGAIEDLRAKRSTCLACGRCFAHCPRQQLKWGQIELVDIENLVSEQKPASDPATAKAAK